MQRVITAILAMLCLPAAAQTTSVLATGTWYKVAVEKEAVYRISYDQFRQMGFDPSNTDPHAIRIFGNSGGMLPQANDAARPTDLRELSIYVEGESDGRFDRNDFILFYGEGPDRAAFRASKKIFEYENNLYTDRNFYFVTVGDQPGKRVTPAQINGTATGTISTFPDFVFHETDSYNDQRSGRLWLGEVFGINTNDVALNFPIQGMVNDSPVRVVTSLVGQSTSPSSIALSLNGTAVANLPLSTIPANVRYGLKGTIRRDTFAVDPVAANVTGNATQTLRFVFTRGTGVSKAYLDYALMSFERRLALYGNQTIFSSVAGNTLSTFNVNGAASASMIWDISDLGNIQNMPLTRNSETVSFIAETSTSRKFVVFNNTYESPSLVGAVSNQNLRGLSTPNLVIITHPLFVAQAEMLANHRSSFNGWSVHVVTTEQVYNEFSSGRQDVSALRDFIRLLWQRNPSQLKAALLFGKCSYDYKDRVANNKNFVATYESRNSLHPLQTYSSDDFFGFLEDNEGTWSEDPVVSHTLDIGIGRLPVKSATEANGVVEKIIRYDMERQSFGPWRKQIVFVADDGSTDDGFTVLHQSQADQLSQLVENNNAAIELKKLYMGSYPRLVRPSGDRVPLLHDDIMRVFDRGALIVNYTGHGNEKQWTDENVFNDQDIRSLRNERYPFLVTATCEFGRHDDPDTISAAERIITHGNGGAIGLVTTARPVNATTNFNLNRAFYVAMLEREGNRYLPIGEVFRHTKNNSISGVSNRNFSLLGDPSMTLALPADEVIITSLKTASGSDTLKALSTVTAKGQIRNAAGEKLTSFNGTVELTLLDKQSSFSTTGRNTPQLTYKQWYNALFRGKARVNNGDFEISFMLPKNIAYQIDQGKMTAYALHDTGYTEAAGAYSGFKIGGTEPDVATESTPPEVKVFIGDSTFVNGGVATPDTWLVAKLTDDSGINVSGFGIGNSIVAVLDDDEATYILNEYFVATTGNPASGWLSFPLKGLSPGKHSIRLTAWDVFNNIGTATVEFIVTDGKELVIETFGSFPNPFSQSTTLFFTHNRSGDDLQAQLFIYNSLGEVVKSREIVLPESEYHVDMLEFEPGQQADKKLSAGLYLARIIVRSLSNGSKNEQVTKLILLN